MLAILEDSDPTDLHDDGITLFDWADGGALERLLESGTGDGSLRVEFAIGSYLVRIDDSRHVAVISHVS